MKAGGKVGVEKGSGSEPKRKVGLEYLTFGRERPLLEAGEGASSGVSSSAGLGRLFRTGGRWEAWAGAKPGALKGALTRASFGGGGGGLRAD